MKMTATFDQLGISPGAIEKAKALLADLKKDPVKCSNFINEPASVLQIADIVIPPGQNVPLNLPEAIKSETDKKYRGLTLVQQLEKSKLAMVEHHAALAQNPQGLCDENGFYQAEAFWWGFHVAVDKGTIETLLKAGAGLDSALAGLAGAFASFGWTPAAAIVLALAVFILFELLAIKAVADSSPTGHIWISMSWFLPFIFIPTWKV